MFEIRWVRDKVETEHFVRIGEVVGTKQSCCFRVWSTRFSYSYSKGRESLQLPKTLLGVIFRRRNRVYRFDWSQDTQTNRAQSFAHSPARIRMVFEDLSILRARLDTQVAKSFYHLLCDGLVDEILHTEAVGIAVLELVIVGQ